MAHHDAAGLLLSLVLGAALGARHAFEPDHLAAVTVISAERPGARRGAVLGMWWGLGHSVSLLGVGLVLALLSTRMPDSLTDALELAVAGMLIALGARAITGSLRPDGRHPAGRGHEVATAGRARSRPLLIGMAHGLAGSGALTALAFAAWPSSSGRIAYMSVFGLGSTLGMAAISGLWGWPLAHLSARPRARQCVSAATGVLSTAIGLSWGAAAVTRLLA